MSAIFLLNEVGKPLLSRNFKGDVPMSCIDEFPQLLNKHQEPCFWYKGVHYVYIRHSNLIIVCVSRQLDLNAMAILHFLYRLVESFSVFVTNVEVESVTDNFVVLYELLDEMMDFGFVQTTDTNLLQDYVTQSSYKLEVSQAVSALTDVISWRPPGIWYRKNELFVDCEETINAQVTPDAILVTEILGVVKLKTYLSGMPLLQMGLNNVDSVDGMSQLRKTKFVVLDDVHFHECVDLLKWEKDGKIEFIPPDGNSDLLSYRVTTPNNFHTPMFKVSSKTTMKGRSRFLIKCNVKAQYRRRQQCRFVELMIPVPIECDSPRFKCSMGSVVYAPELQQVVWKVPQFSGGMIAELQAELLLSATEDDALNTIKSKPILVKFEMPGSAISGLSIRYLKIEEERLKYSALPWVRYLSRSGMYEVKQREVSNEATFDNSKVKKDS